MHVTGFGIFAGYLLLITSFAIDLVSASPIQGSGHLCTAGNKYFTVKSNGGVPYGTCCANNLPGAVWKDDRPICSLTVQLTTPARSVEACPQAANLITKGDLKFCVYSPLKPRSFSTCPVANDYHIIFASGPTPIGTCCPNNLPGAVWKDDKPACSLSVIFTSPATNVDTCGAGSRKANAKGLAVCVYDLTLEERDNDTDTNVPSIEETLPLLPEASRADAGDPVLQSDVCTKNGRLYEFEHNDSRWATCCNPNFVGADWGTGSGPQCCDTKECPGNPDSVKACFAGWEKRTLLWLGFNLSVCRQK